MLISSIRTVNNAFFDPYTGIEADKFQAYRGIVVTWEKMKLKNDPTLPNVSLSFRFRFTLSDSDFVQLQTWLL